MSLGLPEFGSRGAAGRGASVWRGIRLAGLSALAYILVVGAIEWRTASLSRASLDAARAQLAEVVKTAADARRAMLKNKDILVATASVESSPERVLIDLNEVRPNGVSIPGLKIEYTDGAVARLNLTVVARTAEDYDRFLEALSKSPRFAEIRPGAETRPGMVRATLTATHQPKAVRP